MSEERLIRDEPVKGIRGALDSEVGEAIKYKGRKSKTGGGFPKGMRQMLRSSPKPLDSRDSSELNPLQILPPSSHE